MDKMIDFTACIAAGGDGLRPRIERARLLYSEMSEEYFARLLLKRGRAFNESACGFLLADSLLTKHSIDKSTLVISRNADGRPCIINRTDVDFSISHSEGAVLCSLCQSATKRSRRPIPTGSPLIPRTHLLSHCLS